MSPGSTAFKHPLVLVLLRLLEVIVHPLLRRFFRPSINHVPQIIIIQFNYTLYISYLTSPFSALHSNNATATWVTSLNQNTYIIHWFKMRFMRQDAITTCTKIQLFFYSAIFFSHIPTPSSYSELFWHIQKKLSWLFPEPFSKSEESHTPKSFYLTNPERVN